jgi:hypothetical protein
MIIVHTQITIVTDGRIIKYGEQHATCMSSVNRVIMLLHGVLLLNFKLLNKLVSESGRKDISQRHAIKITLKFSFRFFQIL